MSEVYDFTGMNRTIDDMLRKLERETSALAGSTLGNEMAVETTAYIDAKTEAVRAQNDARFAEVLAELRTIHTRLDSVPSIWQIAGVCLTTLGLGIAIIAFAGDRFDAGVNLGPVIQEVQRNQAATDAAQDANMELLIDQLGQIGRQLENIEARLPE